MLLLLSYHSTTSSTRIAIPTYSSTSTVDVVDGYVEVPPALPGAPVWHRHALPQLPLLVPLMLLIDMLKYPLLCPVPLSGTVMLSHSCRVDTQYGGYLNRATYVDSTTHGIG